MDNHEEIGQSWNLESDLRIALITFLLELPGFRVLPQLFEGHGEGVINYKLAYADVYAYANNVLYVFELKVKDGLDRGVGQMLRYFHELEGGRRLLGVYPACFYKWGWGKGYDKGIVDVKTVKFFLVAGDGKDSAVEETIKRFSLPFELIYFLPRGYPVLARGGVFYEV